MKHTFETSLILIGSLWAIRVPKAISDVFPSRGMVMAIGEVGGHPLTMPLEPDGKGSHWFEIDSALASALEGKPVLVSLEIASSWPDPPMPEDVLNAFERAGVLSLWHSVTPKAKWEWYRWLRATKVAATREKRIAAACDKLKMGEKRPCCFDATRCTVPEVSKSGILLE